MYNAGDKKQTEKQRKEAEVERELLVSDVKRILSTTEGFRFFLWLMEKGFIFHTSFTGSSQTFFNEGERNMVLRIVGLIVEAAPEKLVHLMIKVKENEQRKEISNASRQQ